MKKETPSQNVKGVDPDPGTDERRVRRRLGEHGRGAIESPGILGLVLGGSWVVISGVISKVTIVMTHIRGLITLLITAHEPPSSSRCVVL